MHGIDCQITFSLVTKLNTMRVLLSLAANLDGPLHEFDMKNMFLHGNIKEEVYMEIVKVIEINYKKEGYNSE